MGDATTYDRLAFARELAEEHCTEFIKLTAEEVAAFEFAVIFKREGESWVFGTNGYDGIAECVLEALGAATYTEWVEEVYAMATGEKVEYETTTRVTVTIDGRDYTAADPEANKSKDANVPMSALQAKALGEWVWTDDQPAGVSVERRGPVVYATQGDDHVFINPAGVPDRERDEPNG